MEEVAPLSGACFVGLGDFHNITTRAEGLVARTDNHNSLHGVISRPVIQRLVDQHTCHASGC